MKAERNMRSASPIVVILSFMISPEYLIAQTDLQQLKDLAHFCKPPQWMGEHTTEYLYFAPMRRLSETQHKDGKFGYEHVTDEKRYSGDSVSLDDKQIWMVLDLPAGLPEKERPEYLWMLLSVPRDKQSYIAQIDEHALYIDDRGGRDAALWSEYTRVKQLSRHIDEQRALDVLAYINTQVTAPPEVTAVRSFWKSVLKKNYDDFVDVSRDHWRKGKREGAYEHFFSYVRLEPEQRTRHPITKSISAAGVAFGFLLDDRDDCVASTMINIQ